LNTILLTQYDGAILGPIAKVLGVILNGIFWVLDKIGIPNIGLSIILFTIVVYLLLMPLTIKQQKFSKLSAKMNPELQAISAKYKDKKDNESMMAMNEEQKAIYAKYGVSPSGSCVQLLIQMPILFALYRVLNNIPAYVSQVKNAFYPMVEKLANEPGSAEFLNSTENFKNSAVYAKQFTSEAFLAGDMTTIQNTFIDVLNKASTAEWATLAEKFPNLAEEINATAQTMQQYNSFLGLNMGNTPSFMVQEAYAAGAWLMIVGAISIPVLSALTQWINTKLMPQPENNNNSGTESSMAQSMKTMNNVMPLMSAFFCYTMPAGLGLYWVAGSVVRSIQQVVINKHIDKMDIDAVIAKNNGKYKKQLEKNEKNRERMNAYATMNTRNVDATAKKAAKVPMSQEKIESAAKQSAVNNNKSAAKPGSMAAKANMVKDYNERNNKK